MPKISAIILTLNEEKNIGRCLDSLAGVADEVLVVDSFSEDRTAEIAEKAYAKVIRSEWTGYGPAKNSAAGAAAHPFLLFLDADEALSPQLKASILAQKPSLKGAYAFNRLNNYCGTWIRHGGFYPDVKIRLWEKGAAVWTDAKVHETVRLNPGVSLTHLEGDLLHYSYLSHADHRARATKYADLAKQQFVKEGRRFSPFRAPVSAAAKFLKHFIGRLGFLDGREGFWIAWISAGEVWRKYAR